MRYAVTSAWTTEREYFTDDEHVVTLQRADITDKQDGHVYRDGAYRVQVDGKSIKGKGGTAPFFGESAWSNGERLYFDSVTKLRFAR